MRPLSIAAVALAFTALSGCNPWERPPPEQKTVEVHCHCTDGMRPSLAQPPQVAEAEEGRSAPRPYRRVAAVRHHRYAYHHGYGHAGRYDWSTARAERSVDIYNYSSHSRVSTGSGYGEAYGGGYAHGYGHGPGGGGRFSQSTRVWADGYGRRHIYDESAVRHYVYQAHQRYEQEPQRQDPWHGYDDRWDW